MTGSPKKCHLYKQSFDIPSTYDCNCNIDVHRNRYVQTSFQKKALQPPNALEEMFQSADQHVPGPATLENPPPNGSKEHVKQWNDQFHPGENLARQDKKDARREYNMARMSIIDRLLEIRQKFPEYQLEYALICKEVVGSGWMERSSLTLF